MVITLISASQVARITGTTHPSLAVLSIKKQINWHK
jgi:hypothetical protein